MNGDLLKKSFVEKMHEKDWFSHKSNLPYTGIKQIHETDLDKWERPKTLGYINGKPLENLFIVELISTDLEKNIKGEEYE